MLKAPQYRQRLGALFADIERLAIDPARDMKAVQCAIEEMRTRLHQLEADFSELEKRSIEQENAPPPVLPKPEPVHDEEPPRAVPILYEKNWIGYTYSGDEIQPLRDPSETPADIAVPLTASGQPIGAVQIQPPTEHVWTPEEADLLNGVAQQASAQIQNLRLLDATERARAEAEAATRRFIHEGWDSFLDAIHHSKRVGYAYDQSSVTPLLSPFHVNGGFQEVVKVMDEHVGTLYLQPDSSRPLTNEDRAMVASIANQIAQQVENIRLLADASRARAEAEEATRRMTRENWQSYKSQQVESSLGFVYDSNQVTPLTGTPLQEGLNLVQPLTVRGEAIGQLAVAGLKELSQEEADLAAAIANQVSIHLEALRLTEELQRRAAELQELDRLKSSFLANMSHELRTPLNSILGFADVILEELDGPLTEPMDNDLRLIQKNGQHLLHLINDVLDMAKIESGRMNLHPEKFKVHQLLDEVTSITSTLASEKNLSLFIAEDSDREIEIYADNTRLRQVMINLVNNSIKFTETGRITLCASAMEGARLLITVKDTGIGIPPDKLETVFQEFAQVDSSTTRKAGGTGLGLPISRRLVEMHGGRLWVESTGIDGEGSTFFVELLLEARITDVVEKREK